MLGLNEVRRNQRQRPSQSKREETKDNGQASQSAAVLLDSRVDLLNDEASPEANGHEGKHDSKRQVKAPLAKFGCGGWDKQSTEGREHQVEERGGFAK